MVTLPQNVMEDGNSPTEDELKTLRRVHDKIPFAIFLVATAEVAERFAYRCLTGPLRESQRLVARHESKYLMS
jgi:hypothetical protein